MFTLRPKLVGKKNSLSEVVSVLGSEYLSRGGLQLHGSSSYLVFCNYSGVILKQNISDIKGYKSIVCLVNNLVAFLGGDIFRLHLSKKMKLHGDKSVIVSDDLII